MTVENERSPCPYSHARLAVVIDLVIPGRQEGVLRFLELVWSVLAMGLDSVNP